MKLLTCSVFFLSVAFGQNCADVVTPNPPSAALVAAIASLTTAGADVKVHIVETIPAQLELWEKSIESACQWISLDGGRKNSLISVVVATKSRKTGIYFGHVWDSALRDTWNSIQATAMNPHFRDGDYDTGITAGLVDIHRAIMQSRTSASVPPSVVMAEKPVDLSGAWDVFVLLCCLAGLVVLLIVAYKKSLKRRVAPWHSMPSQTLPLRLASIVPFRHLAYWAVVPATQAFQV